MFKNQAGQRWVVYAFNRTTNAPTTGDAANITAKIAKDGAALTATNDVNPTELEDGFYAFDTTQAETNADELLLSPESSTADIQVIGVPAVIYTRPANFADLGIETDGHIHADLKEWLGAAPLALSTQRVQTIANELGAQAKLDVNAEADTALTDYDAVVPADLPTNFGSLVISSGGVADANVQSHQGIIPGVTGQIQAVTADTPSAGITRITIQDPGLPSDADDQFNNWVLHLVDRTSREILDNVLIGDYDFTNLYVYVDAPAITPTTAMDYYLSPGPKDAAVSAPLPRVDVREANGQTVTASAAVDLDDLAAILLDTAEIGAAGAGLSAVPWNAAWDAEVQSEATDALNAYDPPTNAEMQARTLVAANYATSSALATVDTNVDTLLTRITSTLFSGITSLAEWLGLLAGKQTGDATARTELRATGAGSGTYDETSDSLEAIRDRGDASWVTGGGGSITQSLNVQPVLPVSIDLANTATVRLGIILVNALDDLPSTAEITPGTISIERKAIGGTSWSAVVTDAAMSEQAGMVYYDEVFDSGSGYAEGDSVRVTFKSVSITADANTHEVVGSDGILFQTQIRETMRGTDSAYTGTPPTAAAIRSEIDSNSTQLAAILADTNELQSDDVPGLIAGLNDPTVAAIADAVWDEVITGAEHNVNNSSAKFLREGSEATALTGTAQGATAGTLQLASGAFPATAGDNYFRNERVSIIEGTGAGQSRLISGGTAASDTVTLYSDWDITPSTDSVYAIMGAEADVRAVAEQAVTATGTVDFDDLAAILADTNELQSDDVPALIAALNDPTAAAIADAVWDELQSAHTTVGSFGEVATEIAAILEDTATTIPGLIAALNDVSAADVNAQLVDVLSTDTQSLPGQGDPTATPTLTAAILYLYKAWRNKVEQTATEYTLYADDGTTPDQKATVEDDGTTFTRNEVGTGA